MTYDPDLPARSAVELRQLIQTRQISPVELLEACIARIEAVNPFVNAVTATCFERARREARAAERAVLDGGPLGLLHGLPMGVKDLEATEGLLTTLGSPLYRNHVPAADNVLVARLRSAGAIVAVAASAPSAASASRSAAAKPETCSDTCSRRAERLWLECSSSCDASIFMMLLLVIGQLELQAPCPRTVKLAESRA